MLSWEPLEAIIENGEEGLRWGETLAGGTDGKRPDAPLDNFHSIKGGGKVKIPWKGESNRGKKNVNFTASD